MDMFSVFFAKLNDEQLKIFKASFDNEMAWFVENGLSEKEALKSVAELIQGHMNAVLELRKENQAVNG